MIYKSTFPLVLLLTFSVLSVAQQQLAAAGVTTQLVKANGLEFNCRIAGEPTGKPVLLLHGWPATSHMWEPLMIQLAKEGYYCIAPDQRGLSTGARPKGVKKYDIALLSEDIVAIADQFGFKKFQLIGHDWGSAIGYAVCNAIPDRVDKYISMSLPHPQAFGVALNKDEEQKKMSSYIKLFQYPWLPEWKIASKDYKILREVWVNSTDQQVEAYLTVFSDKKALTASLNYYRANYKMLKQTTKNKPFPNCTVPNLFVWGKEDTAIGRTAAEGNGTYISAEHQFVEIEAGHWLIEEAPEEVTKLVLDFLDY